MHGSIFPASTNAKGRGCADGRRAWARGDEAAAEGGARGGLRCLEQGEAARNDGAAGQPARRRPEAQAAEAGADAVKFQCHIAREESTLDAPAPKQTTDQVAKKRKEVSKKLKAAETQPPDMPGESSSAHGEKVVDISSMTDEEFNALPAATLKRLRGDIG